MTPFNPEEIVANLERAAQSIEAVKDLAGRGYSILPHRVHIMGRSMQQLLCY